MPNGGALSWYRIPITVQPNIQWLLKPIHTLGLANRKAKALQIAVCYADSCSAYLQACLNKRNFSLQHLKCMQIGKNALPGNITILLVREIEIPFMVLKYNLRQCSTEAVFFTQGSFRHLLKRGGDTHGAPGWGRTHFCGSLLCSTPNQVLFLVILHLCSSGQLGKLFIQCFSPWSMPGP